MKKLLFLFLLPLAVYAQDLQTGVTFSDGDTVNAAALNNSINNATILATFLSNKGSGTPTTTDLMLFYQGSTSSLKQTTIGSLFGTGFGSKSANTFLAGPTGGGASTPTFRTIAPADTANATNTAGGTTIDCSIARTFSRTLAANTTYTLTNISDGETVTVAVKQAAAGGPYTSTFTVAGGITWRGGTAPTQTTTANKTDLATFIHIGSAVYGSSSQNY